MTDEIIWWWLSYADETGNLGVVIVAAPNAAIACEVSKFMKLSPGGECKAAVIIPESYECISLDMCFKLIDSEKAKMHSQLIDFYLEQKSKHCEHYWIAEPADCLIAGFDIPLTPTVNKTRCNKCGKPGND